MNQAIGFGSIGTFGKPRQQQQRRKKSKPEKSVRRQLFKQFARQYGTRAFPAVSEERHQCIKAWLRDRDREGCKKVVGEMRQFEYLDWLKQGLKNGKFSDTQKQVAKDILGRGKEDEPVHKKKGELDNDGEVIDDGPDWMLLGGAALLVAGGWWWFYGRKGR